MVRARKLAERPNRMKSASKNCVFSKQLQEGMIADTKTGCIQNEIMEHHIWKRLGRSKFRGVDAKPQPVQK